MNELKEWLTNNHIQFDIIEDDEDILNLPGFGYLYFYDMENQPSLFRKGNEKEQILFSLRNEDEIIADEIYYCAFKFGNNFYYTDLREEFKLNILKYVGTCTIDRMGGMEDNFVNLGIHTPFELLNSSFLPGEWVKKAKFFGHKAIGICDYNTMAGTFDLQKACKDIRSIFGYSLTVSELEFKFDVKIYVTEQQGLQNLLRIQKYINVDSADKTISIQELCKWSKGNIIVFDKCSFPVLLENAKKVNVLINKFDVALYQIDANEYKADTKDVEVLTILKQYIDEMYLDESCGLQFLPPVLISDCYYLDKDDSKNKVLVNKIRSGTTHDLSVEQYYKPLIEHYNGMKPLFERLIDEEEFDFDGFFEYAVNNVGSIADIAVAKFETGRTFMPQYDMLPEEIEKYGDRLTMFEELVYEGLENRRIPAERREEYEKRLEEELYVIKSTNNVDYFLVQWDLINWARKNDILVGYGRGSSAGSLVSYCLNIVNVDPIRYNLLFERFIIPERAGLVETDVTFFDGFCDINAGESYVILDVDGKEIKVFDGSKIFVKRDGEIGRYYPDELKKGDEIILDNYDTLWSLDEIFQKKK